MKILIILICLLINTGLYAQETEGGGEVDELDNPDAKVEGTQTKETPAKKKPEGPKAKINNNYLGLNLVYNMATLIEPEVQNPGYGFDVFYQSHISDPWAYQFQFTFLYNTFSNPIADPLEKEIYIVEEGRIEKYTKDETFNNYGFGFIFSYSLLFKETFGIQAPFLENIVPYFSVGVISSFIIKKTIAFNYEKEPLKFSDTDPVSKQMYALNIPFGFGFKIIAAPGRVINLMANYTYVNNDDTSQNFAYKDIINFKLGYLHGIKFRL